MRAPTDVSRRVHRTYVRIRARGLRGVVEKCRASGSSVAGTVLMLLHLKRFVQSIPRRIRDYVTRVTRASLEDRSSVSRFLGFPGNASKLDLRAETGAVGGGAGGREGEDRVSRATFATATRNVEWKFRFSSGQKPKVPSRFHGSASVTSSRSARLIISARNAH